MQKYTNKNNYLKDSNMLEILQQISNELKFIRKIIDELKTQNTIVIKNLENNSYFYYDPLEKSISQISCGEILPLQLLYGIDKPIKILINNTLSFAQGKPANHVLLWGAPGTGKSSAVKGVFSHLEKNITLKEKKLLKFIEVSQSDIEQLPDITKKLSKYKEKFIIFIDDLSFTNIQNSKNFKIAMQGSIQNMSKNIICYATTNRRHLIAEKQQNIENNKEKFPFEETYETLSISDRFGLWIGFYPQTQDDYLKIVKKYIQYHQININTDALNRKAIQWSIARGSMSGRTAQQFIINLAIEQGLILKE